MKKSLIALAVLGSVAGAASAQSSVTIYGVVDMGVSKLNSGKSFLNSAVSAPDVWTVKTNTSSRLGFRGTEDLGGGLKANFNIEHRFSPDTGATEGAVMWHGTSWVGLSGGFGEVRAGRQYVPAFYVGLAADTFGYDYNVGGLLGWTRGSMGGGSTRADNQITYSTPNMGGFTAQVGVAAGEGVVGRNLGFNVMYAQGPLQAGFGYNDTDGAATNRYWNAMAAYNFGMIRPVLSYSSSTVGSFDTKGFTIGATAPLGANGLLRLAYGSMNPDGANNDGSKMGLGYQYSLSKRTSLNVSVGSGKTDAKTRVSGYQAGVKHTF
jgi:predicted porin